MAIKSCLPPLCAALFAAAPCNSDATLMYEGWVAVPDELDLVPELVAPEVRDGIEDESAIQAEQGRSDGCRRRAGIVPVLSDDAATVSRRPSCRDVADREHRRVGGTKSLVDHHSSIDIETGFDEPGDVRSDTDAGDDDTGCAHG